jgi:hypothetical protein
MKIIKPRSARNAGSEYDSEEAVVVRFCDVKAATCTLKWRPLSAFGGFGFQSKMEFDFVDRLKVVFRFVYSPRGFADQVG